jgi:hypothetical protein
VSWAPVRVEALEPYPLAAVVLGGRHALAVTQQVRVCWWEQRVEGRAVVVLGCCGAWGGGTHWQSHSRYVCGVAGSRG